MRFVHRTPAGVSLLSLLVLMPGAGCQYFDVLTVPPPPGGVSLEVKSAVAMIVAARLNGHDVNAFIDTGTILTTLASPRAIEQFGLRAAGDNPFASADGEGVGLCGDAVAPTFDATMYAADRLELGGVVFENLAVTILIEEDHDTFAQLGVDFILPAGVMMQMDWQVDDGGRRLTLFPAGSRARPSGAADMTTVGPDILFSPLKVGVMTVNVSYGDGEPLATLLDTGGGSDLGVGGGVLTAAGWSLESLPNIETNLFAAGGSCPTKLLRAPRVKVGELTYDDVLSIMVPGESEASLLGWAFLSKHAWVYVSARGAWVEFVKDSATDEAFSRPLRTFGFSLELTDDQYYRVASVRAGGGAAAAGVVAGEKLIAINGVDLSTFDGKALLFGRTGQSLEQAEFLIESELGEQRTVTIASEILL